MITAAWVCVAALPPLALLALSMWCRAEDHENDRYEAAIHAADAKYLNACAAEGPEMFIRALRDVVRWNSDQP